MTTKQLISIRLDSEVFKKLKDYSEQYGIPYARIIDDGVKMRLLEIKNGDLKRSFIRSEDL